MAVGIDLGTSNTCVAVSRDGKVEVISNQYGEPISASAVAFLEDGSTLVGNQAKARIASDPTSTVTSSKRLIGRYYFSEEVKKAKAVCSYEIVEGSNHSVRIAVRDRELAISEISATLLREMREIAEEKLGEPVTQAVITVPAYFNDNQRQATRDAGRLAGLDVLRLLNEPTAAAVAYGFGRGLTQRVAVYDLGGGTFDISILEIGDDVFEVLSTCGDTFLGGEDFDDRLLDLLSDEFHAAHGINLRHDPRALETLKAAAEEAKKSLSVDDRVEIRIPDIVNDAEGNPLCLERDLTQQEYEGLVGDLIQRTFKVCDEAVSQAGLTVRDLDGVILVGGPTRLPLIRTAVKDYFQCEPKADVDPDQVVAMGAAIHAASLSGEAASSCLLDVTPLSLRIGVAGGLAETVIERNTPVPIEQTRTFTTFRDFQESVRIRVYQGESRKSEGNELLGEFEFTGFKKARRGEVGIDVTFEIDTDGIVSVTAREPESGQAASTRIHLSAGMSESEIQAILDAHNAEEPAVAPPAPAEAAPAAPARSETLNIEPEALTAFDEELDLLVSAPEASTTGAYQATPVVGLEDDGPDLLGAPEDASAGLTESPDDWDVPLDISDEPQDLRAEHENTDPVDSIDLFDEAGTDLAGEPDPER